MMEKECLAKRIQAAKGEISADLVLENCKVVNVFNGKVFNSDVALYDGIVIGFSGYNARETVDMEGGFLLPGFIDGHIHLESSMITPGEFARAIIPHGTTAIVADPHEIANVLGLSGIDFLLKKSEGLPVDMFFMIPSCVPATHLETSGASLGVHELQRLKREERILGLAEMMNYPGVINTLPAVIDKLNLFQEKIIDGHAPLLRGRDLNAYITGGIRSDHECSQLEEAEEKLSKGMWIMVREGSQSRNLAALAPLVNQMTSHRCMLVSDDRHPDDLLHHGHIDSIVNRAVSEGIDPVTAIQMVTINPAIYFNLSHLGAIAPGFQADLFSSPSLYPIRPDKVFKRGKLVAEEGKCITSIIDEDVPVNTFSMNLAEIRSEDLVIPVRGKSVRAIKVFPDQLITEERLFDVHSQKGHAMADIDRDLLKIAVIERHRKTGNVGLGFVHGFGLKQGAIASSVAHDSHNIIVVGCDDLSMITAVNSLREGGGGITVSEGSRIVSILPLPIAGLLSDEKLEAVVSWLEGVRKSYEKQGGALPNPFMALSFLALPVIPDLKITDRGLVDVRKFDFVSLFE